MLARLLNVSICNEKQGEAKKSTHWLPGNFNFDLRMCVEQTADQGGFSNITSTQKTNLKMIVFKSNMAKAHKK